MPCSKTTLLFVLCSCAVFRAADGLPVDAGYMINPAAANKTKANQIQLFTFEGGLKAVRHISLIATGSAIQTFTQSYQANNGMPDSAMLQAWFMGFGQSLGYFFALQALGSHAAIMAEIDEYGCTGFAIGGVLAFFANWAGAAMVKNLGPAVASVLFSMTMPAVLVLFSILSLKTYSYKQIAGGSIATLGNVALGGLSLMKPSGGGGGGNAMMGILFACLAFFSSAVMSAVQTVFCCAKNKCANGGTFSFGTGIAFMLTNTVALPIGNAVGSTNTYADVGVMMIDTWAAVCMIIMPLAQCFFAVGVSEAVEVFGGPMAELLKAIAGLVPWIYELISAGRPDACQEAVCNTLVVIGAFVFATG